MCTCDTQKRGKAADEMGDFDWGGCSDNVNYGIRLAKAFVDAKEKMVKDARALMNIHNNRCGRMVRINPLEIYFFQTSLDFKLQWVIVF